MFLDGFVSNTDILTNSTDSNFCSMWILNILSISIICSYPHLNMCLYKWFTVVNWSFDSFSHFSKFHWFGFCIFSGGFLKCYGLWIGVHASSKTENYRITRNKYNILFSHFPHADFLEYHLPRIGCLNFGYQMTILCFLSCLCHTNFSWHSEDSSNWQLFHHNPLITLNTNKTTSLWNHCWFICCFTFFLKIPEIDHSPILIVCDFLITFIFQITSNIENTKSLLFHMLLFLDHFILNPHSSYFQNNFRVWKDALHQLHWRL